jgi:hypothetical protein
MASIGSANRRLGMIQIDQNLRELSDSIVYLNINAGCNRYPTEFQTYAEAWKELFQSLAHLRGKLGEDRYMQMIDMAAQAKAHYDASYELGDFEVPDSPGFVESRYASWLMLDMEQVVKGKPPGAYPDELYRWSKG